MNNARKWRSEWGRPPHGVISILGAMALGSGVRESFSVVIVSRASQAQARLVPKGGAWARRLGWARAWVQGPAWPWLKAQLGPAPMARNNQHMYRKINTKSASVLTHADMCCI